MESRPFQQRLKTQLRNNWGWIVALATNILFLVIFGIGYSYGLFFIEFQKEFNSGTTVTGWVGSIPVAFSILLAPLTKFLLHYFSHRLVCLIAVLLATTGLVVTSFMPGILLMFFSYSLVFGVGLGVSNLVAIDLIICYFPGRNCVRAVSLGVSGTGIGMFCFAPLINHLQTTFGWRMCLRILSAIVFIIGMPSALTYIRPTPDHSQAMDQDKKTATAPDINTAPVVKAARDNSPAASRTLSGVISCEDSKFSSRVADGENICSNGGHVKNISDCSPESSDINSRNDQFEVLLSKSDIPETLSADRPATPESKYLDGTLKTRDVFMCPELWMLAISVLINGLGDCFYYISMVSFMVSVGFTEADGARVLSVIGVSNLVGKLVLSLLGEYFPFPSIFLLVIATILDCLIIASLTVIRNRIAMIVLAAVVGGVVTSITCVITYTFPLQFFGPKRAERAWPVILFSNGMGYLVGSVVGQSVDRTGSYNTAIWVFVGLFATSCAMLVAAPLYQKFFAKQRYVMMELFRDSRRKTRDKIKEVCPKKGTEKDTAFNSKAAGLLIVYERVSTV